MQHWQGGTNRLAMAGLYRRLFATGQADVHKRIRQLIMYYQQ
ncbi:hypothetical protein [Chitinophaga niastensis]|nr:hypothetical protein [Chitinophaga niastensis]